jgi:hypothetical protein
MPTVQKQFMFIHIPKTAGTTFVLTLARHFKGKKTLPQYYHTAFKNFPKHSPGYLNRFDLSYGHVPLDSDMNIERGIEYYTFLRNPRERLLSGYRHIKGDGAHGLKSKINVADYKLKDFLKNGLSKKTDNLIVRYLSNKMDKDYMTINEDDLKTALLNFDKYFSVFGLTEYFDESLVLLSDHMSWSPLYYFRENNSTYKIDTKELDEETEKLILACNKYDEILYKHALDRFLKLKEEKKAVLEKGLKELREGNEKKRWILSWRNKGSMLVSAIKLKLK